MLDAFFISIVIVLGGAFIAVLVAFSPLSIISGFTVLKMRAGSQDQIKSDAALLKRLAIDTRSSGTLAMEEASKGVTDPFLREALFLAAGGIDTDSLRDALTLNMSIQGAKFEDIKRFWQFMVTAYSVWGMIGALTGLVLEVSGSEC